MAAPDIGQMVGLTGRGGVEATIRLSAIALPAVDPACLTSLQPQALAAPDGVILDCANTSDAYQREHIPGAAELYGVPSASPAAKPRGRRGSAGVWWSPGLLLPTPYVGALFIGIRGEGAALRLGVSLVQFGQASQRRQPGVPVPRQPAADDGSGAARAAPAMDVNDALAATDVRVNSIQRSSGQSGCPRCCHLVDRKPLVRRLPFQ